MTFGISSAGFNRPSQADIENNITIEQQTYIPSYKLRNDTADGQIYKITANLLSDLWQSLENVYYAYKPSTAEGKQLDDLVAINGLTRLSKEKSTVVTRLSGSYNTVIPVESLFKVENTEDLFQTTLGVVIPNNNNNGTGYVDVILESVEYGEIEAPIGTLNIIRTPISGLTSVYNYYPATLGRLEETNEELRTRRELTLSSNGKSSSDAMTSNINNVSNVIKSYVFVNDTDGVNPQGLPAHSFEALVFGGEDEEIANAIWQCKPAGIPSYGNTTVNITDSQDLPQIVNFSRPEQVDIYIAISLEKDSSYPIDGDDLIKQNIINYFNDNISINDDIIRTKLFQLAYIQGVVSVIDLQIGTAFTDMGTENIITTQREIGVVTSDTIVINENT